MYLVQDEYKKENGDRRIDLSLGRKATRERNREFRERNKNSREINTDFNIHKPLSEKKLQCYYYIYRRTK